MYLPIGYYVYAYLRQSDLTPYYIGKGYKKRAWDWHGRRISLPPNKSLIVILEQNLTELGAFAIERRMIRWYGRKDLGTGILINKTDGGEGTSGHKWDQPPDWGQRLSIAKKGKPLGPQRPEHAAKSRIACLGKKLPQESLERRSKTRTGMKYKRHIDYKQTRNKGPHTKVRSDKGKPRGSKAKQEIIQI